MSLLLIIMTDPNSFTTRTSQSCILLTQCSIIATEFIYYYFGISIAKIILYLFTDTTNTYVYNWGIHS